MATKHNSAGNGWQAITHHRLFATVVPLWLAATFALSTLAVRGELIERVVLSAKLDLILPMATPPLGTTARLLLALAFGVLGGVLGWAAVRVMAPRKAFSDTAWQQARRQHARESASLRRRSADAHPDFPARQPIQAHAELGEYGFDNNPDHKPAAEREPAPQISGEAPGPSHAPPPPVAESWEVLHDVPPPPAPAEEHAWDWQPPKPPFVEPTVPPAPEKRREEEDRSRVEPARSWIAGLAGLGRTAVGMTEADLAVADVEADGGKALRYFQNERARETVMAAPHSTLVAESVVAVAEPVAEPAPQPAPPAPQASAPAPAPAPKTCAGFPSIKLEGPSAAEHIATASLESLSHVELLERLARALQRHQEAHQGAPSHAVEKPLAPAPDGTGDALRAALASLRDVK